MHGEHVPETQEYGISSFSYGARRPFHPAKFFAFLHDTKTYGTLLRSKGYFWLATRPEYAGQWSQAGAGHFANDVRRLRLPIQVRLTPDFGQKSCAVSIRFRRP